MEKAWVCKFGGTSLANASQIKKVKEIIEGDSRRRFVVVSAPGKEDSKDTKITDLLLECHSLVREGKSFEAPFNKIRERFQEIGEALRSRVNLKGELDKIYGELPTQTTSDYAASRGEYLNALLLSEYFGGEFVDASEVIRLTNSGQIDESSYPLLAKRCEGEAPLYVIPGFYGLDEGGSLKTFSRGGSDITGAIVARAIKAELYENWSDVSGIYLADPRIAPQAIVAPHLTYHELALLAQLGASVFHRDAVEPVVGPGIPIRVKNTNDVEAAGTLITAEREVASQPIVGVLGLPSVHKLLTTKETLQILDQLKIDYYSAPEGEAVYSISPLSIEERGALSGAGISFSSEKALVGVVGEGWQKESPLAAKIKEEFGKQNLPYNLVSDSGAHLALIETEPSHYTTLIKVLVEVLRKAT